MGSTPVEMTVKNIRYGKIKTWRVARGRPPFFFGPRQSGTDFIHSIDHEPAQFAGLRRIRINRVEPRCPVFYHPEAFFNLDGHYSPSFPNFESYQAALSSLKDHV
jgi:hypothetical protein